MIGLLPASGRAERLRGLPKFAIPDMAGEPLIVRHHRLMRQVCDEVRICTTAAWAGLVADLLPSATLLVIAPSTMNDAVQRMADPHADHLVGMPDTYYAGPNPYPVLEALQAPVGVACWQCPPPLRGRVGQVDVVGSRIRAVVDKDPACEYRHLWGALRLSGAAIAALDPFAAHPGIDLPRLLDTFDHAAAVMGGDYIDCGTPAGVRDMLNQEAP